MTMADTDKRILDGLSESVARWTNLFFSDEIIQVLGIKTHFIQNDLPELRRLRWFGLHDTAALEKLWKRFVENGDLEGEERQSMFDFYMNGATFMWMNNPVPSGHYDSFISHLATTLSWVKRAPAVPTDTREHVGSYDEMKAVLKDNHWVVFMVVLSMTLSNSNLFSDTLSKGVPNAGQRV